MANEPQKVHEKAALGFQIAGDAYERGRPEYPKEAIEHLVKVLKLGPNSEVADLGAGTGKFTKLLAAYCPKLVAVEPVQGMMEKFRSVMPGTEVLQGSAESIPLPDHSLDAVVAAQAFHWFQGDAAVREIHRVLKKDGKLGLIWNARDESIDWVSRLTDIVDPHEGGAPRYKSMEWQRAFTANPLFSPLDLAHFRYVQKGPPEMIRDRIASISFISALAEPGRQKVLDQVEELIASHPDTRGKEAIELPYRTDVFWCQKIG